MTENLKKRKSGGGALSDARMLNPARADLRLEQLDDAVCDIWIGIADPDILLLLDSGSKKPAPACSETQHFLTEYSLNAIVILLHATAPYLSRKVRCLLDE